MRGARSPGTPRGKCRRGDTRGRLQAALALERPRGPGWEPSQSRPRPPGPCPRVPALPGLPSGWRRPFPAAPGAAGEAVRGWSPRPWRGLRFLQLDHPRRGWSRALPVRAASARRFLQRSVRGRGAGGSEGGGGVPVELRKCCRHRPRRKSEDGGRRVAGIRGLQLFCVLSGSLWQMKSCIQPPPPDRLVVSLRQISAISRRELLGAAYPVCLVGRDRRRGVSSGAPLQP